MRVVGRMLLGLFGVVAWTALAAVALAVSLYAHVELPVARRVVRDLVNSLEMHGALVVNRFDEISTERIVARHVMVFDGDGRRVAVADSLVLVPERNIIANLLRDRGNVRFQSATLSGAIVRLSDAGDGLPTLFGAFDSRTPSATPTTDGPHIVLERVALENVTLYGDLLGLHALRARDVSARGTMEILPDGNVEVKIAQARGDLVEPFGFVGVFDALSGTISTRPERGVALHALAHREKERADVRLRLASKSAQGAQELDLQIAASEVSSDTLARLGYTWAEPLAIPISGNLRLRGPLERLHIEGALTTDAGPVQLDGTIATATGVKLHLATENIAVAKLVPTAPAIGVKGAVDIEIAHENATPHLHIQLAALRYKGVAIPAIEVNGEIESDRLRITQARSTAKGARLSARGSLGWDGSSDLDVDAYFPAIERDPNLARLLSDVRGSLTAQLHVRTPRDARGFLDISGRVVLTHFVYGSIAADRVTLSGSAKGDPDLPTLRLTVLGENTSVLAYALGTARFAMHGGPRGYEAEGEFQAKGQKTFNFSSKILADRKGFVVQAEPIEFAVGESTWRGVARDLRVVHGDRVELGLLRLASRSQRLEAQGVIRIHGEDNVSAQLQDFDLAAIRALLGKDFPFAEGRADATVEIHGDVARPELLLQGAMRGGKVFDIEGVDALYSVSYANGRLDVDTEIDTGDRGRLDVKGHANLDPTLADVREMIERGRYDLRLDAQELDLRLAAPLREAVLGGRASGNLQVKGTLEVPELDGSFALADLRLPDVAPLSIHTKVKYLRDRLSGELAVDDTAGHVGSVQGALDVAWSKLRDDDQALANALLSGSWDLQGETAARRLDRLPFSLPADLQLPIILGTRFDLRRRGGPAEGSIRFTATPPAKLAYASCNLEAMPELRGMILVERGTTRFSFTGHLDGRRVSFGTGEIDVAIDPWLRGEAGAMPARLDLQGTLDVDDMRRFPWLCEYGTGSFHTTWNAKNLLTDAPNASLQLTGSYAPRTRVRAGRRQLSIDSCRNAPITLWLDARANTSGVTAKGQLGGCHGGPTEVLAFLPIQWNSSHGLPELDDERDVHVQLDFENAELRPLLDRIPGVLTFSALADGELLLRASKRHVEYTGNVTLHDGKLYPIATGQQLRDISAQITGNGTWLRIEQLSAKGGAGTIAAQGGLGFERFTPKRLQLALLLEKFPVQREGVDLAWLTGSAAVSTDIEEDRARTAIKLHSLAVRLPDANSRSLQPLEPHPDVTLTTELREHPDIPYVLEFFVDGRRQISVKRNDFDASIATELAMSYQDPDFRVGGYVEFRRGTFEVFGKDFALNRGSLHFDGTGELNPEINMVATHEPEAAGSSPVVAVVTGTLADPHVEFNSDSCPGDGAVVMLVSGRCPTDDPNSGGNPADAQNAFAAGVVGGILTLGAKREFGHLIPRISVESTGQGQQSRVKAGFDAVPKFMRSLVQRVYVQGAVSSGEDSAIDFQTSDVTRQLDFLIELYFPHNIVGSGKFSPERYWGLDVTWEP